VTARGRKKKDSVSLCTHDFGDPADRYTGSSVTQVTQVIQDTQRYSPTASASDAGAISSVSLWDLPLPEFLKHVLEELDYDAIYPPAFFHFVRMCKGYWPEGTITADAAFDEVAPIVKKLGGWPPSFGGEDIGGEEEAYTEFVTLWDKVRYRADETPLTNAAVKAKAYPLGTLRSTDKRPLPGYDRFVSLAGWLQVSMGDRPIMLPCRACAEILDTSPNMVSLWRKMAIEDGYLKIIKESAYHPNGKAEATTFRFDTSRWPCLAKIAQRGSKVSFDYAEFFPNEKPVSGTGRTE